MLKRIYICIANIKTLLSFRVYNVAGIVLFFMGFVTIQSCRPKNDHYEVKGVIRNLPQGYKKMYLEQVLLENVVVIDTATINKNGEFEFNGFLNELSLCRLRFSETGFIYLVLKNGDHPTVDMDFNAVERYTVRESPASSSLKVYQDSLIRYTLLFNALKQELKNNTAEDSLSKVDYKQTEAKMKGLKESLENFTIRYVDTVNNPINAIFALAQNIPSKEKHYDFLKKYADNLATKYSYLELARQFSITLKQSLVATTLKNTIKVGSIAPDIALPGRDSAIHKLSDLRGKYVLIDFWASWCRPCRSENPNVVSAWKKFRKKNFTVFSVSLDTRQQDWLDAIEADKLEWDNHVCDFKEWHSPAHDAYGFSAIPYNVLIDPDGKILATDLHDEDLFITLKKVLR